MLEWKLRTLLGRYEPIEAVKTTDPLMFNLMNALAATRAVKKAPKSFVCQLVVIHQKTQDQRAPYLVFYLH
jgi:hypothetical protein